MFYGFLWCGPSRLMGTVVEVYLTIKGIIWPKEISPFHVHLISLGEMKKPMNFTKELKQKLDVLLTIEKFLLEKNSLTVTFSVFPLRIVRK